MDAPWRRRRRAVLGRARRQGADDLAWTMILGLVAGALLVVTTGLAAMAELERFGPGVGGIVAFRPDPAATEHWSVQAAVVSPSRPGLPSDPPLRSCTLNPGLMAVHGGSLVIEARRLGRPPAYRVHWAGGHTGLGPADCGTDVDLVLERTELMRLANVAGGFTAGIRLIGP